MKKKLIHPMEEKYQDYLSDQSKLTGQAESISFPANEDQAAEIIATMRENDIPVTIQGAKTGVAGCAVPAYGHILNFSAMKRVKELFKNEQGKYCIKVEPGITLFELQKEIRRLASEEQLFWPPDPTETSATIGGIASCDAKGICASLYGETREHIEGIRVIQSDGSRQEIKRGEKTIPFMGSQKDLLDIYLGGEGMFGALTELTLKLQPKPKEVWGFMFFFVEKEDLFDFADNLINSGLQVDHKISLAAAEYIDRFTIDLIEEQKKVMSKLKYFPTIDPEIKALIYLEVHSWKEDGIEEIAEVLMAMAERYNSNPDRTWAVTGDNEIEKIRSYRHAAAECVNMYLDKTKQQEPRITKLESYLKMQEMDFRSIIIKYETDTAQEKLKAAVFGHLAGNHLHANILPESYVQYENGLKLLEKWARECAGQYKKIEKQHGVGKLKKTMFLQMAPEEYIKEIQKLKRTYDLANMWNPENMF